MTQQKLTIAEQAATHERDVMSQIPAPALEAFQAEKAAIADRQLPAGIAAPGTPLPETELLDVHGAPTTLAARRDGKPAVLVFYRGAWCPYCNMALRTYQAELLPELTARGIELIAVNPQKPDGSLSAQEINDLSYTVVSDPGNALARSLGVVMSQSENARTLQAKLGLDVGATNADGTDDLPLPTTLVVDTAGVIRWIDVRPDYTTRAEVSDILDAVAEHLDRGAADAHAVS
jgi:peroxiredoxin